MTLNNEQHTIAIVDCVYNVAYFTIIFALQTANNASLHWSEEPWPLPFANWLFPIVRFSSLNCTFQSVPKAFFVPCMTHWSLFPCYSCHGMGNGQIGADAHEQAPQLFPRTVEIMARAFLSCFPHEVCHQVLWRGKQGEGGTSHFTWTDILYFFTQLLAFRY